MTKQKMIELLKSLKRYDTTTQHDTYLNVFHRDIEESSDGEFVKWDDLNHIIKLFEDNN